MQYTPKVKFHASLSGGDIVPGAAFTGYETTTFSTTNLGLYHCLLEDPASGKWEICRYDPSAASGFRRQTIYSSSLGALASTLTGLTCSFVAHPNSYVLNTHAYPGDYAPIVRSSACTGIGANTDIGTNSAESIAIGGVVRDDSAQSVVVGQAFAGNQTVTLGYYAKSDPVTNSGNYTTYSRRGSVAIGNRAQSTVAGEVALGSASIPHMSGVPVMTADPSAGGTFTFKSVAGYDDTNYLFILEDIVPAPGEFLPGDGGGGGNSFGNWIVHVQGVIVARATDPANDKVVKVEWVTGGSLTQTVLTNGANNISLGLALSGMMLQATVAAVGGLKLSGYLHLTKINW